MMNAASKLHDGGVAPAETPMPKLVSELGYMWYIRVIRILHDVFMCVFIIGTLGLSESHLGLNKCYLGPNPESISIL